MKIMTILGVRPEIIRLSMTIKQLDDYFGSNHILVNTGQNFDPNLNDIFMQELNVRAPNYHLGVQSRQQCDQIGQMMVRLSETYDKEQPDYIFVLGDTNTGVASAISARHYRKNNQSGLPIFHMEAGNRSFDKNVPEETNRSIIDHISTWNLTYTHRSKEHLYHEGLKRENIFVVGNPICEVINHYRDKIDAKNIFGQYNIEAGKYILVTLHRSENVDVPHNLATVMKALENISIKNNMPVIFSTHPRTKDRLKEFDIDISPNADIRLIAPFGFLDSIKLQENALLVASDSGTVPEESAILGVANIMLRNSTERLELLDNGCSILTGTDNIERIMAGFNMALNTPKNWQAPSEYLIRDVSKRVLSVMMAQMKG